MGRVFEVRGPGESLGNSENEFADWDDAKAEAEIRFRKVGSQVEVITWATHLNVPGCEPEIVYKSCALNIFDQDGWRSVFIHG